MTINTDEHKAIQEHIDQFLTKLEELGVANALICYSCNIHEHSIGWVMTSSVAGDPMAAHGMAQKFLEEDDGDDDGLLFMVHNPDSDGGACEK